nr:hypothetical protein [Tanacetum cinerariifolium]
ANIFTKALPADHFNYLVRHLARDGGIYPGTLPLDRVEVLGGSPLQPPSTKYQRTLRVILFSIHNDEWKSVQSQHQTALRPDRVVDEEDKEPQVAHEPQIEDDEYNLQRGVTRSLPTVKGKGKGIATDEHAAQSLLELPLPKKKNDTSINVVHDTLSSANAKTGADMENTNSEGDTKIHNVDEERDPSNTLESRPLPDEDHAGSNHRQSHVALTAPNPEPMHEDFISTVYPKNINDAFTFGDQFIDDKPTKKEPGKANVESKVESIVTGPIHQASSSAPPLSTPIIDVTTQKPISPPIQEPVFIATTPTTTTITTTLLPPPPPQQQITTNPKLATRVSTPEQICANFEKNKIRKSKLSKADLEGLAFKIDLVNPKGNRVVPDISKPLHLEGPPGQTQGNNERNFV